MFIFLWMLVSPMLFAADPPEARQRYPYAVLERDVFEFGKLEAGPAVRGTIIITNEGAVDLLIAKVRGSCGLMIPSWPASVSPGGEAQIHFRYDGSRLGPFERHITIHTNAWQKDLVVKVRGEILPSAY